MAGDEGLEARLARLDERVGGLHTLVENHVISLGKQVNNTRQWVAKVQIQVNELCLWRARVYGAAAAMATLVGGVTAMVTVLVSRALGLG